MHDKKKEDVSGPNRSNNVSPNILTAEQYEKMSKTAEIKTEVLTVKHALFQGYLTFDYWWENNGGLFYCYFKQYSISPLLGDISGDKANLHYSFDSLQWWGRDSPDDRKQDGGWYNVTDNERDKGGWVGANKHARVFARFAFDIFGPDPIVQNEVWFNY
ncbi:hypothetical protein [Pseudomonas fluorescens]|uniref:Uncharacterized protein n=1 Tax=Pseudomonas fluorescens TaxID=294 RepID=A0A5E7R246_PSEFL|nr:hypothetical protein [Pseudomonas fluorescens]VVO36798.1 hypothetical protein PS833_05442 [Pseudomonas fluorescens]VVP68144.1 hypothetical protein PS914_00653 [Pseudomonas fluorescens]